MASDEKDVSLWLDLAIDHCKTKPVGVLDSLKADLALAYGSMGVTTRTRDRLRDSFRLFHVVEGGEVKRDTAITDAVNLARSYNRAAASKLDTGEKPTALQMDVLVSTVLKALSKDADVELEGNQTLRLSLLSLAMATKWIPAMPIEQRNTYFGSCKMMLELPERLVRLAKEMHKNERPTRQFGRAMPKRAASSTKASQTDTATNECSSSSSAFLELEENFKKTCKSFNAYKASLYK